MIIYDEDKLHHVLFRCEGSVAPKAALMALPAGVLAALLVVMENWLPGYREDLGIMEINASTLWSATTATTAVLMALRTNRAMARFWEGTSLLHQMRGEWFDAVSCCVTFTRGSRSGRPHEVTAFRHTLVRLMSLAHRSSMEEISSGNIVSMETIDPFGLDDNTLRYLKQCREVHAFNRVEVLMHMMQTVITCALDDGILKIPPPILSRVYQTLSRGFVNLLNAKKICDTRFPFPHAQMIAALLCFQTVCTPVLLSGHFSNPVWAFLFAFVPCFGLWSLNLVAIQLENPFGRDQNDLPLDIFQRDMNNCLMMLLQEQADVLPTIHPQRCITGFHDLVHHVYAQRGSEEDVLFRDGEEFGLKPKTYRTQCTCYSFSDQEFIDNGVNPHGSINLHRLASQPSTDSLASSSGMITIHSSLPPVEARSPDVEDAGSPGGAGGIAAGAPCAPSAETAKACPAVAGGEGKALVDAGRPIGDVVGATGSTSGMEEFQETLRQWTDVVGRQLGELQWNLAALKAFRGAIIEDLHRAPAKDSCRAITEDQSLAAAADGRGSAAGDDGFSTGQGSSAGQGSSWGRKQKPMKVRCQAQLSPQPLHAVPGPVAPSCPSILNEGAGITDRAAGGPLLAARRYEPHPPSLVRRDADDGPPPLWPRL